MKKKIRIIDRTFRACCIILLVLLIATIAVILLGKYTAIELSLFLLLLVPLSFCLILMVFIILRFCINWAIIDGKGILIKSFFGEIKSKKWDEIENIFIYSFKGTEEIGPGQRNVGGILVNIPKLIPQKWIFVSAIDEQESGENIFEYFIPQRKTLPIRLQYRETIIQSIKEFYSNMVIEKTINAH